MRCAGQLHLQCHASEELLIRKRRQEKENEEAEEQLQEGEKDTDAASTLKLKTDSQKLVPTTCQTQYHVL